VEYIKKFSGSQVLENLNTREHENLIYPKREARPMDKFNPQAIEQKILKHWDSKKTFAKCKKKNEKAERFRFIDGPPYTTGSIHLGTAWNKVLKDMFLRYKRMQGYNVRSQPGYDMHGLPIEVKVEEKLGIKNKQEISDKIGMDKFIEECRKFGLENLNTMSEQFARLGVWMDWEKPYRTIDNSYIEGAWWALAEAHKKGLLYEGPKSITWCWRCATALAKHELEYKTRTDTSIYVKFPIKGKKNEYILIWTTTPWTLPFNLMVAVHPDYEYVKVKVDGEIWILAKNFVIALMGIMDKKYEVLETLTGADLKGVEYTQPFEGDIPALKEIRKDHPNAFTVQPIGDDMLYGFVTLSAGSGCVHCAPGCGAEDFEVGRKLDVPAFSLVDENGNFSEESGKYAGLNASKDNKKFIGFVKDKGLLAREAQIDHEYAHCWRCKSPVIFRAVPNWYLKVTELKEKMIEENKKIKWVPDWAGERWFRDWLENLQDWCISRQRFWGIPLPIWRCENGHLKLIGSRSELPDNVKDLHRPWIDKVKFKCKECGKEMTRVTDILDVWLDSGAAPWATLPFPEKKTELDKWFPCEFITEGKDQIRGWFNSMLCLSMVSHGKTSYKSVYMHGFVVDDKGLKMSKSLGNSTAPEEVIEKVGSEAWRFYSIGGAANGEDMRFNWEALKESYKALNILWNVAKFTKYMDEAGFNPEEYKLDQKKLKPEDKWILSRVNTLNQKLTQAFEDYEFPQVPKLLHEFLVEDLSRWYVKLIRDRTWVSATGDDKLVAFKVLYESLKTFLVLSAPLLPILNEEIYLNIIKPLSKKLPESIHLLDWPKPNTKLVKPEFEKQMAVARSIVETARFAREEAKIKLRWPLKQLSVDGDDTVKKALKTFENVILEQANVKSVKAGKLKGVEKEFEFGKVYLDTKITPEIRAESLAREVMRQVQVMRKKAGLQVSEKIKLTVSTSDDFAKNAINKFAKEITEKVGAKELKVGAEAKAKEKSELVFEDIKLSIGFTKLGP
tara:strand:+ start:5179 stop:8208 length:3030 start_codon:yes stop_codon:yes gene_type:complete